MLLPRTLRSRSGSRFWGIEGAPRRQGGSIERGSESAQISPTTEPNPTDLRVQRRHKKREGKVEREPARVFCMRLSQVRLKIQFKRPCLPGGVWRESSRDSRTVRCMEAANDYITQSIGVLSKHGRSLKGIRRVEVFDIDPGDAMTVNRRLPLTFDVCSKSSCRRVAPAAQLKLDIL